MAPNVVSVPWSDCHAAEVSAIRVQFRVRECRWKKMVRSARPNLLDDSVDVPTYHVPPFRASPAVVERQRELFDTEQLLGSVLNELPDPVMILNTNHQIVFANRAAEALAPKGEIALGLRLGELADCRNASVSPAGCGTTEACMTCGQVNAILAALEGDEAVREWHITTDSGDAVDLQVAARPLTIDGQLFVSVALADISDEKRRQALERMFFHDVLNAAAAIRGLVDVLSDVASTGDDEIVGALGGAADQLIDVIRGQHTLSTAEDNDLAVQIAPFTSRDLIDAVVDLTTGFDTTRGRAIVVDRDADDVEIVSDRTLLGRVLINLVKNALEASDDGMEVRLDCRAGVDTVEFTVHNDTTMPRPVQLQVFTRSFSTKGTGRGLGTYGAKLLTERYLGGRVEFTSTEQAGTTFHVAIPKQHPADEG